MTSRRKLLSVPIILAACFAAFRPGPAAAQEAPLQIDGAQTVSAADVVALASQEPGLVILDNRHPGDFKAGAIEGAKRLIDTEVDAETLAALVPTKSTPVLCYCNGRKCGRAARAVARAVQLGYSRVYYYAEGMAEWRQLGLPVVPGQE